MPAPSAADRSSRRAKLRCQAFVPMRDPKTRAAATRRALSTARRGGPATLSPPPYLVYAGAYLHMHCGIPLMNTRRPIQLRCAI